MHLIPADSVSESVEEWVASLVDIVAAPGLLSWMAGMLYPPRLFVYQREAEKR